MDYNFEFILEKTINHIKKLYGIDVYLFDHSVTLSEQVAQWENNIIAIDIRERGTLGTLFILAHVFGHLVQYGTTNRYDSMLDIVNQRPLPLDLDDNFKEKYFLYEQEAYQFGKNLLLNIVSFDTSLENKYNSFMYTDFEHFWSYLTTGKRYSIQDFNSLWDINLDKESGVNNVGLIEKQIPSFIDFSNAKKVTIAVI